MELSPEITTKRLPPRAGTEPDERCYPNAALHMTKSRAQIDGLTGIRFFAALHVVIFHCTDWATSDHLLLRRLASTGFVAVDLFFVLSGFILTYTNRGAPLGRDFYVARA